MDDVLPQRVPAVDAASALTVDEVDPGGDPSWADLIAAEPRLEAIRREAAAERDRGGSYYCPIAIYYMRYKPRLRRLVGWGAPVTAPPLLRTSEVYEQVVGIVVRAIGGTCRDCACLGGSQ